MALKVYKNIIPNHVDMWRAVRAVIYKTFNRRVYNGSSRTEHSSTAVLKAAQPFIKTWGTSQFLHILNIISQGIKYKNIKLHKCKSVNPLEKKDF